VKKILKLKENVGNKRGAVGSKKEGCSTTSQEMTRWGRGGRSIHVHKNESGKTGGKGKGKA